MNPSHLDRNLPDKLPTLRRLSYNILNLRKRTTISFWKLFILLRKGLIGGLKVIHHWLRKLVVYLIWSFSINVGNSRKGDKLKNNITKGINLYF